ncbi:hypothetical protein Vsou_11860 [Vulcanisaeta souniana JCM 11219]|uniref:Uncharacterized protein n=1 Tax=Vulcanisaeta souniana JCM 11219 TaxID=1293586 RepID=A0ABM8BM32_9CREN|nr:hypothetical protein Vsou_11860 [Vulcanisaeta souniana JCM 11219]
MAKGIYGRRRVSKARFILNYTAGLVLIASLTHFLRSKFSL